MLQLIAVHVSVNKRLLKRTVRFSLASACAKKAILIMIMLGLRSQREKDQKFKACLGYTVRFYLKK